MFVAVLGEIPGLFKADIDAAFRRIPIKPARRWACGITFRALNKVRTFALFLRGPIRHLGLQGLLLTAFCVPLRRGWFGSCLGTHGCSLGTHSASVLEDTNAPLRGRPLRADEVPPSSVCCRVAGYCLL